MGLPSHPSLSSSQIGNLDRNVPLISRSFGNLTETRFPFELIVVLLLMLLVYFLLSFWTCSRVGVLWNVRSLFCWYYYYY
jgi:hypothetical protein